MKKILVSLIMALVALLSVTTTQAFVPESGLKILNATDFSEVPQGDRVVIAKFLVKTDSSRVLTDSWQVGLKVSGGDANDLGTVFWTTTTGETVAYSETFKRMGDQRARMTILTPDQQNWGEASFQSYPLRNQTILLISVNTLAFPDLTKISVTSVSLVGVDMMASPRGEFVWSEVPGGITSTVTVRTSRVEPKQVEPTPVVIVTPEALFTSKVTHWQDVTFRGGNPGLFIIFSDMIPAGARTMYLNDQLHWVTPVFLISQDSALLFEGEGEILDFKIVLP